MKKALPRKEFELRLLDLRCKALRKALPNLSERTIALTAKKWVKAQMRRIDGEVVEYTMPDPEPLNKWEAFKEKHFPTWLKRFFPVVYAEI